jgi:F0F1-type ATP synthase assembly protein I
VIALGLAVELIAAVLLVVGLLEPTAGTPMLWGSVGVVLLGLCVTAVGVRRARPPRNPWMPPPSAAGTPTGIPPD